MATIKKLEKLNYNTATDAVLRDRLFDLGIAAPISEENNLIRKQAVRLLREWDQQFGERDDSKKVRVIFHSSSNPSAGPYVFASVNNMTIQAPYDKEVEVPEVFLRECIDRAQTVVYEQNTDKNGNITFVDKNVPVYPYTFLGYVEEASTEK